MAEMSRFFETNNNASSHWLPANALPLKNLEDDLYDNSFNYTLNPDDNINETKEDETEYKKKVNEFNTSVQEKFEKELREEEIIFIQKWTNTGLQIVALITEHLVSHPFMVLRRQCQVNNKLTRCHIVPVTLIPIVINIHRWQGITCLWKGVGSVLVIKGLTLAVQDLLSKLTSWPKEMSLESSTKNMGKHLMLKFCTCAIITPFYSASLLETVQSEIASEKPEFLDVFKEGFRRLISFGYHPKGRMLPVWSLVVPTAIYFITKHLFTLSVKTVISKLLVLNQEIQHRKQGAIPKNILSRDQDIELSSSLVAVLSADIVLYPLETILHRLHLQGTRTIIDDLDDGLSVTPILTNFEGVVDCYKSVVSEEGSSGLYKGFGALVLQCLTYTSILKLSKFVFTQISYLFCKGESSYNFNKNTKWEKPMQQAEVRNKKFNKTKKKQPLKYDSSSSDFDEFDNNKYLQCKKFTAGL